MKKHKVNKLVKAARKVVRNNIQASLVKELSSFTDELGQKSKKLNKQIEKGSRQLAKKLSKEIKIDKSALVEAEAAKKPIIEEAQAISV